MKLVLLLFLLPAIGQAQFTYTTQHGEITITRYTGSGGAVTIPATLNHLPVSSIGNSAFFATRATSMFIPDTVVKLGSAAFFGCKSLTSVTLGSGVATLGDLAFGSCPNLKTINCRGNAPALGGGNVLYDTPATLYYLPGATGWGSTLAGQPTVLWNPPVWFTYTTNADGNTLTINRFSGPGYDASIPNSINFLPVSTIGDFAFAGYDSLNSVTIPNSVSSIGDDAFIYTSVTNIIIPDSVTNLGSAAFIDCSLLASIVILGDLTRIENRTFAYCSSLTNVALPGTVTSIDNQAFFLCTCLNRITIPNSVTNIGNAAFSACRDLACVNMSSTVKTVGGGAFYDCAWLTNFTLPDSVTSIGSEAFNYCVRLASFTIPRGVSSIADDTFGNCFNLQTVKIPEGLTNIGSGAFSGCSSLTSITIPNHVTSIGYQAFEACASLTNAVLSNGVSSIGIEAFSDCTGLLSVTIPASVTNIGNRAFTDCSSLAAFTVNKGNPFYQSDEGVLFNPGQTVLIQFPGGKAGSYIIPNTVTNLGDHAFAWSYKLSLLGIPSRLTNLDSTALGDCTSLAAIEVAAGNPFFSSVDGVLYNQNQSVLVLFPAGRGGTFIIPNSVTNIGDSAFFGCAGLTNVVIPNSVVSLGYGSFSQCSSLISVTIPGSVQSFGGYTFYNCASLTSIYFEGSAPEFVDGSWNFFDSGGVTVYYVPGVTFLGWPPGYGWPPTAPWLPQIQTDARLGVPTNQFGFNLTWASGQTVVVEASTNLASPNWQPVQTNPLTTGTAWFSDPRWTNYPSRFYRLRSP